MPRKQEISWIWTLNGHTARNVHDGYTTLSWLQDWSKRSLSLALRSFYPVWANFGRTGCAVAIARLVLDCMSWGVSLNRFCMFQCFNLRFSEEPNNKAGRITRCGTVLKIVFGRLWWFSFLQHVRMREMQRPWNFKATTPRWPWRRR